MFFNYLYDWIGSKSLCYMFRAKFDTDRTMFEIFLIVNYILSNNVSYFNSANKLLFLYFFRSKDEWDQESIKFPSWIASTWKNQFLMLKMPAHRREMQTNFSNFEISSNYNEKFQYATPKKPNVYSPSKLWSSMLKAEENGYAYAWFDLNLIIIWSRDLSAGRIQMSLIVDSGWFSWQPAWISKVFRYKLFC